MPSFGSSTRRPGQIQTSQASSAGVSANPTNAINWSARNQAQDDAIERWKQQDAINTHAQQQINNAQRLGYAATGPGAYGTTWSVAGQEPVDNMRAGGNTARASSGSGGGGGGSTGGYQDLSMSDYNRAYGTMGSGTPKAAPGHVAPINMLSRTAAEDAAYGRARDQAGEEMRAGADSLSDEMSARGISGGGVEGALLGQILTKGQGQLGEVNREQAVDRMRRADQVQDTNYQGDIQQRSQDLTARGQDIEAQNARQSNAMRLMDLLRKRVV